MIPPQIAAAVGFYDICVDNFHALSHNKTGCRKLRQSLDTVNTDGAMERSPSPAELAVIPLIAEIGLNHSHSRVYLSPETQFGS